jgi:hypothetical protein
MSTACQTPGAESRYPPWTILLFRGCYLVCTIYQCSSMLTDQLNCLSSFSQHMACFVVKLTNCRENALDASLVTATISARVDRCDATNARLARTTSGSNAEPPSVTTSKHQHQHHHLTLSLAAEAHSRRLDVTRVPNKLGRGRVTAESPHRPKTDRPRARFGPRKRQGVLHIAQGQLFSSH